MMMSCSPTVVMCINLSCVNERRTYLNYDGDDNQYLQISTPDFQMPLVQAVQIRDFICEKRLNESLHIAHSG